MVSENNNEGGLFGRLIGKSRSKKKTEQPEQTQASVTETPAASPEAPASSSQATQSPAETPRQTQPKKQAQPKKKDAPAESAAPATPDAGALSPVFQAPLFMAPKLPRSAEPAEAGSGSSHRRRARRKEGEESAVEADSRTVVKVRPKRQTPVTNEPTPVKGSTRLEAKRQRRSSGREAGRRRTVITDVEFQARREAVDREMIVRSTPERIQIGVIEDKVLVEHYVAKSQDQSLIGNVYLGKVQNVLPSMEAAFVDIGRGRNAVLYSGEVDWAAAETGNNPRRIEFALKPGDTVLVQVTKDPVGHKGARLTSQISLPGRYLVYVPGGSMNGISRKLPDSERARLKKVLKEVLPESAGVIVRTAAEGATEEQLTTDVRRLQSQWEQLQASAAQSKAPALLHSEPDLLIKIVRDVFNEDFTKMVVSGDDAMKTITSYISAVAPELLDRIEPYQGSDDVFDHYRINETIEKALERKVWLPSGGSLVIDRTEAMTVIDVNTGKFVGSGGNLEETVTKNNLEAAEEIVRQLRLRDIGGIIVVDFIDMVLEANRDLVLRRLIECLGRDRTKHQVAEVTSLGLIQMTRKKLGIGLLESFSETCEVCGGRGVVVHSEPVFKHRSSTDRPARKKSDNGHSHARGGDKEPKASAPTLSEDVKLAVAQIAASTIAGKGGHEDVAEPAPASAEAPTEKKQAPKRSRSSRSRSSKPKTTEAQEAGATQPEAPVATAAKAEEPTDSPAAQKPAAKKGSSKKAAAPLPDLPLPAGSATPVDEPNPVAREQVEHKLGSVLDALAAESTKKPAPRRRSRRATLPAGSTPDQVQLETDETSTADV